jgi:REP element-mobilizing transposase RayT
MPQSLAHMLVHLIFSTKERMPLLIKEVREELNAYIVGILHNHNCHPIIVASVEDHVHVLFYLAKDMALSKAVERIKSNSSKWIKTKSPSLANFQWQNGYSAFSVSQSNTEAVRAYVARQEEHHHKISFMDEVRSFLEKHKMNYDERYLWD